jgi:hypothetical protein
MSDTKELPPVPWHCDRFRRIDYETGENSTGFVTGDDEVLDLADVQLSRIAKWRKIIAAVARVAWLDEARVYDLGKRGPTTTCTMLVSQECRNNAELWKKWGEG